MITMPSGLREPRKKDRGESQRCALKRMIGAARASVLVVVLLVTSSCGGGRLAAAEEAVARFHLYFSGGDFSSIYAEGSPKLRESVSQEKFVDFLAAVKKRLGRRVAWTRDSHSVRWLRDGAYMTIVYVSRFELGEAGERFTLIEHEERWLLAGYRISSELLPANGEPP